MSLVIRIQILNVPKLYVLDSLGYFRIAMSSFNQNIYASDLTKGTVHTTPGKCSVDVNSIKKLGSSEHLEPVICGLGIRASSRQEQNARANLSYTSRS